MVEKQMFPRSIPHRVLELCAFRTQGQVVFGTLAEHAATPRAGRPRWQGLVAVTTDGVRGASYDPGMPEELMNGPNYDTVHERVLAEGVLVNG